MIFLKDIDSVTRAKHLEYFNNLGRPKLINYINGNDLPDEERLFFRNILETPNLIENIITGKPQELLKSIDLIKQFGYNLPHLLIHFMPERVDLHEMIKGNLRDTKVCLKRKSVYNSLSTIDEMALDLIIGYNGFINNNLFEVSNSDLTINKILSLYKEIKYNLKNKTESLIEKIKDIFDYEKFIKTDPIWNAYSLVKNLSVNVCPYCNRSYIHTISSKKGKSRAELDHFYPKSRFPFLALSIYNLVPSCHICNSSLKGSKDFYIHEHIHPYVDCFTDRFRFTMSLKKEEILKPIPNVDDFKIEIEVLTKNEKEKNKIINSKETFQLETFYNLHKIEAVEICEKKLYYNETRVEELRIFFSDLSDVENDDINIKYLINRFIYGDDLLLDKDSNGKILSKFKYDLVNDYND